MELYNRGSIMEALVPKPLESSSPEDLHKGLYKILHGIQKEFGFDEVVIAKLLHKPRTTVNGWFKNGSVKVSKDKYTPDDVQIYELIELYDTISSYFVKTEDQVKWLETEHRAFNKLSPLLYIFEHPSHLRDVRRYLEARMNP
ncbi:MAG: hypothetical protein ACJAS4_001886 [Bacteriovoracaceae bacterium]|jgi:hypothetical protein